MALSQGLLRRYNALSKGPGGLDELQLQLVAADEVARHGREHAHKTGDRFFDGVDGRRVIKKNKNIQETRHMSSVAVVHRYSP